MDIGRAFSFVFEDPDWIKKILIGGLISLIGWFLLFIPTFILVGYALEVTRRVYLGRSDPLPEWNDIGGYLVKGLILTVGLFLWLLPPILLITCVGGGVAIAASASGDDVVAAFSGLFLFGLISLFILVILLWSVVLLPVLIGRYAVEGRLGAMFEFDAVFQETRTVGAGPLLLLLLLYVVSGFIGQLGLLLCFVGVVFTTFFSYLVLAHGVGQVYRAARQIDDGPASTFGSANLK